MCYIDEATERLIHVFAVDDDDGHTPRETRCECGEATWGELDDLLLLTTMWERTPSD